MSELEDLRAENEQLRALLREAVGLDGCGWPQWLDDGGYWCRWCGMDAENNASPENNYNPTEWHCKHRGDCWVVRVTALLECQE